MGGAAAEQRGLLRGVVLAGLIALLTVVGHLAGGGAPPAMAALVVLLPPLAWVLAALAEHSRSAIGAIGVLAAGQFALHQLIEAVTPAHPVHHAMHTPGPESMGSGAMHSASAGAGMVVMHAVATLAVAAALRFADRGIAGFRAVLRRVLPPRPCALAADRPLAALVAPGPAVSLRLARELAVAHVRRGPPVGC